MTPEAFVSCAREYVGTQWIHQGRLKGVGVDCIGILRCAATEKGIQFADITGYAAAPSGNAMVEALEARFIRVPKTDLRLGNVMAFYGADHNPWHVGIVSNEDPVSMIHAWRNIREVKEVRLIDAYRRRIHSVWRFAEFF